MMNVLQNVKIERTSLNIMKAHVRTHSKHHPQWIKAENNLTEVRNEKGISTVPTYFNNFSKNKGREGN